MSTSGTSVPVLVAAFVFGVVVNAASAALFLHVSSHGASVFRDGQRLVLVTFLASAALWALADFISITVDPAAAASCQIGIVFTSFFDQLARFSVEQYLIWALNKGAKSSVRPILLQVLVVARFVLGAVFVGFSRPQFNPACVPQSSVFSLAVVTVALDAVLIVALTAVAVAVGLLREAREDGAGARRSKSILLVLGGFTLWTAMSVAMLLGMRNTGLLVRTLLPAIGLLILVFIATACNDALTTSTTGARSAPDSPGIRNITTGRSISTDASSDYPPSRFEDLKRSGSISAFEQPRQAPPRPDVPPLPSNAPAVTAAAFAAAETMTPAAPNIRKVDIRPKAKRGGLLDWRSGGLANKAMVISDPILNENGEQNPLSKIATISLADAARNESRRRAEDMQRTPVLVAKRPAPRPPNMSAEEAIKRSASLKRKEIASVGSSQGAPLPPMPPSSTLKPDAAATVTSSAELSPGIEDLRRRSPRQVPADRQGPQTKALSRMPSQIKGLPANPRAAAVTRAASAAQGQTVMFMNNIVYNNPAAVQSIIDDANIKGHVRNSSQSSIVHRPRPIPRQPNTERGMFPAEPSPHSAGLHRPKSGGSVATRKSAFYSNLGSPTQLPPLPPPPKSAARSAARSAAYEPEWPSASRPKPNSTKSMTFDEKMTLLFPAPPSGAGHRRSSLPEIPPIPTDFMPIVVSPTEGYDASRMSQSTSRTGRTSIKTESFFETGNLHRRSRSDTNLRYSGGPDGNGNGASSSSAKRPSASGLKRASSPVLPPLMVSRDSTTTVNTEGRVSTRDDATSNWGSLHSPVVAVPIPAGRSVVRTTYIHGDRTPQMPSGRGDGRAAEATRVTAVDSSSVPLLPATTYNGTVSAQKSELREVQPDNQMTEKDNSHRRDSLWHRRVGDVTLSFSDRKERTRSRKMPPPTPLLLNPPSTKNPVIVKAAEPSPLDSPERALAMIEAQLKKLEEPNLTASAEPTPMHRLALLDNLEKEMDVQAGHWQEMRNNLRHDSLASFQTPSSAAESRRQSALSSAHTSLVLRPGSVGTASIAADRRASRRSRMQQGSSLLRQSAAAATDDRPAPASTLTVPAVSYRSVRVSSGSSSSSSKKHFASAVSDLGALGSPTPPDSDDSDTEHNSTSIDAALAGVAASKNAAVHVQSLLWTPSSKQHTVAKGSVAAVPTNGLLWTADARRTLSHPSALLFAAICVAVAQEADASAFKGSKGSKQTLLDPLPIASTGLWSKSADRQLMHEPRSGLWAAPPAVALSPTPQQWQETYEAEASSQKQKKQEMQELELEIEALEADRQRMTASIASIASTVTQKAPRPVTQRPPRRSKRITMLPDIVENPEPLPDKRGTLGIFQFPWGERSDTAEIRPRNVVPFMPMPGTMSSGVGRPMVMSAALDARAQQLEAAEYSSSFFDDYDDEDAGAYGDEEEQGFGEDDDDDSDDGFDETTLWEIASLLKTDNVPSKLSLLPPPLTTTESVVGDYLADMPSDEDTTQHGDLHGDLHGDIRIDVDVDIVDADAVDAADYMALDEITVGLVCDDSSSVMPAEKELWSKRQAMDKAAAPAVSLAQPDEATWKSYDNVSQVATARTKPRKAEPAQIETAQLWDPSLSVRAVEETASRTGLWAAVEKEPENSIPNAKQGVQKQQASAGLWAPQTTAAPAGSGALLFDAAAAAAAKMASAVVRTTDLAPTGESMARMPARPRDTDPLPTLTSTGLWTPPRSRPSPLLWTPKAVPVPRVVVEGGHGLFNGAVAAAEKLRQPVRTTDMEPAAVAMVRVPRSLSHLPELHLTSFCLWTPPARSASTGLWAPKASVPLPSAAQRNGLFDRAVAEAEKLRQPVRTTDKEPAGLSMVRVPRSLGHLPELQLTSTRLWIASRGGPSAAAKQLWVAPKTVRLPTAARGDGLFDAAVAAAEALRQPVRTTSLEPAAADMMRVPRSGSLAQLPELRVASSRLWTAEPARAKNTMWILGGRGKHRRGGVRRVAVAAAAAAATKADWEQALQEAVSASYPTGGAAAVQVRAHLRRVVATAGEWAAALDVAVARSYPVDVARRHPVLAGRQQLSWTEEKLLGDASKLHPVFFRTGGVQVQEVVQETAQEEVAAAAEEPAASETAYSAHIVAMESLALARLRMLEGGGGGGVVLRY